MNPILQKQLYQTAPILYEMAKKSPEWKDDVPDDLFLSSKYSIIVSTGQKLTISGKKNPVPPGRYGDISVL